MGDADYTVHADCGPVQLTLIIEREEIRTNLPTIDRSWRWTDAAGHEHKGYELIATARAVEVPCGCDLVREEHTVFDHYECRICRAVVKPKVISGLLAPPQHAVVDRYCEVQVTEWEGRMATTSTYRTTFKHGQALLTRAQQAADLEQETTAHRNVTIQTERWHLDPLDTLTELKRRDDAYLLRREVTSG